MMGFMRRLAKAFAKEDGTASIEFVLAIPVLMTIFMASFESGMFMARHVMLERAVDMTMRDLRLGILGNISHNDLRTKICSRAVMLHDCNATLMIELQPVNTTSWVMPTTPTTCVDRAQAIQPVTTYIPGGGSEPVLVRVCTRQNAMFPSTGIGLALQKDAMGGYALASRSVFVNEPS
jgi:hypothetical protein